MRISCIVLSAVTLTYYDEEEVVTKEEVLLLYALVDLTEYGMIDFLVK